MLFYERDDKMLSQEPLFLPYDPLFENGDSFTEGNGSDRLIAAASFAVKTMLKKSDKTYGKLKLPVFEAVFSAKDSVADISRQRYPDASESMLKVLMSGVLVEELKKGKRLFFFPLREEERESFGSVYAILPPKEIIFFKDGGEKRNPPRKLNPVLSFILNKKRKILTAKVGAAAMKLSQNELAFVTRFNEETFFKNVPLKPFSSFGITEKKDLSAFTALYTIAFYGLSLRDIYTVDEVFSFSSPDIRGKDDVKHRAASELSRLAENADCKEKADIVDKMGESLFMLPLPEADTGNLLVLAENYVFYNAAADMGAAYLKAFDAVFSDLASSEQSEKAHIKERARLLADHRYLAELCVEMSALSAAGKTNAVKTKSRKKAESVSKRTRRIGASSAKVIKRINTGAENE